jgi:hypothetical protein
LAFAEVEEKHGFAFTDEKLALRNIRAYNKHFISTTEI